MPVSSGGFTRFRKRQWGYQGSNVSVIGTKAVATRVIPWRGVPNINLNYTFPEQDEGSLHRVSAPSQRAVDITASVSGPLNYNDAPYLFTAGLIGGITPTGGGTDKTWAFQPTSLTASPLGMFTEEYGDDVTTDWWQLLGIVAESFTLTGNDDMGPLQVSANLRGASWNNTGSTDKPNSGTVPTAGLSVDATPVPVYLGDCELFINSTSGAIGSTKITSALHSLVMSVGNNLDLKRWANGSNTRFSVQGYGQGEQAITLALTFAKTSQTVGLLSENDLWFDNTATKRYCELRFTSPEIITGVIPYSLVIRLPLFYTIRDDGEIGNNTTLTLTGTAVYDSGLAYAARAVIVNSLASL